MDAEKHERDQEEIIIKLKNKEKEFRNLLLVKMIDSLAPNVYKTKEQRF